MGSVTLLVKTTASTLFSQEPANFEMYVSCLIPKLWCRRPIFRTFFVFLCARTVCPGLAAKLSPNISYP